LTTFIDSNVLIYAETAGPYRQPCRTLRRALGERRLDGRASVLVIEEVWHLERRRRLGLPGGYASKVASLFEMLLPVTPEALHVALALDAPPTLGSADRLHVATCVISDIDTIVSADVDFDGVGGLGRVDPLDGRAVERLLGTC
jgi:predicted nucleic acid-binding protein